MLKVQEEIVQKGISMTVVRWDVNRGKRDGGPAFLGPGHGGIRTDFMDVEFDNFKVTQI